MELSTVELAKGVITSRNLGNIGGPGSSLISLFLVSEPRVPMTCTSSSTPRIVSDSDTKIFGVTLEVNCRSIGIIGFNIGE